uniref:Uncharacterized protein n=1 Tax=Arundo donax TaxID=35708 RepID=A0A0A9AHF1_ARUDO
MALPQTCYTILPSAFLPLLVAPLWNVLCMKLQDLLAEDMNLVIMLDWGLEEGMGADWRGGDGTDRGEAQEVVVDADCKVPSVDSTRYPHPNSIPAPPLSASG